jgi:hypothetical protein
VVITVLGQNGGQAAPILKLDVGRNNWRSRPDPRYWSKYYRSAPALLGLEGVAPTGTLQAEPQPTPAAIPAVSSPVSAPADLPAVQPNGAPTSGAAPGQASGGNPGSSTTRSPGRSTNQPAPAGRSPEALPSPDVANPPPAINLPAVPAGVGIPAILR